MYINNGKGQFEKAVKALPNIQVSASCVVPADIDGDGDIDAATCGFGSKEVWWFENDGKGRFTNHRIGSNQESYDIRAVDIDGDGDLDLAVALSHSEQYAVAFVVADSAEGKHAATTPDDPAEVVEIDEEK